jgi:hypothetical protein
MTFPLNNTKELFNYIGCLNGVSVEGSNDIETNIETIEFTLNNRPWIHAARVESMKKIQVINAIAEKAADHHYPIKILFTKDQIFIKDSDTLDIPLYSIDSFLDWLLADLEYLQPIEYRAFNDLKALNYSFTNLLADTLSLKEENIQLKHDKQYLINELSETHGKLKSAQENEKNKDSEINKFTKMNIEMANFTIQNNKLISEKQVSGIVNFYKENVTRFSNPSEFTISFYKSDKLVGGTYNKYYTAWIEGAGIDQRSHEDSTVYFDQNGEQLLSIEVADEKLFSIEWTVFVSIYKNKIQLP